MTTRQIEALIDARVNARLTELVGVIGMRASVPEVMTWQQAMTYVGKRSYRAFQRWCQAWHVYPCGHGRYARTKLELGQQREARGIRDRRKAA